MIRALPRRRFRAVFLDAGGTLLRPHPSQEDVTAAVLTEAGVPFEPERLAAATRSAGRLVFTAHGREPQRWGNEAAIRELWLVFYAHVQEQLGRHPDDDLSRRIYDRFGEVGSWALYEDVLPALDGLAARGITLGIVSDWGTALVPIIHAMGLSTRVSFAVVSAYAGSAKPDRDVFQYALDRAGVTADEAIHVGDFYLSDVLGARGAGVEPILIDRAGAMGFVDCVVVRSLTEIPSLLDAAMSAAL